MLVVNRIVVLCFPVAQGKPMLFRNKRLLNPAMEYSYGRGIHSVIIIYLNADCTVTPSPVSVWSELYHVCLSLFCSFFHPGAAH